MLPTLTAKRGRSKTGMSVTRLQCYCPTPLALRREQISNVIGCETCRSKKVKCDEQRPNCARCCRLKLRCGWPTEEPPLKAKRRGYGSIKSRAGSWRPKKLLSALSNEVSIATEGNTPTSRPIIEPNPCIDAWVKSDEWWEAIELDHQNLAWHEFPIDELDTFSPPGAVDPSGSEFQKVGEPSSHMPTARLRTPTAGRLSLSPSRPLSDHHFIVPNALILTPFEHQALNHYQTVFSLYRSTKDPKWSTHKMLLNYGSHNPMIMHFILAVSINDYSICLANEHAYQGAQNHFEIATGLWVETMKKDNQADHLTLMISFFFLYLYMTKRSNVTHQRLRKLSKSAVDFVKKNKLDTRCLASTSSLLPDEASGDSAAMTTRQRSLLARLIMWTSDEDVKCGFQGSGGHLAQYLSENDTRTKNIYDASRSVLENHWRSDYPDCQVFDDNENSVILEFLFALMPLQQDINELSSRSDANTTDICRRIQRRFTTLEQDYSSVFRIAATRIMPRTRVLVNADYDVVLFNALRIYYFRSTITDLTMDTPPEICLALKNLLSIVRQTFAFNGTELHERLQWPLFLAGIETDDPIYREWIILKLTSYCVLGALKSTLEAQQRTGKRLTMMGIRDLLYEARMPTY